MDPQGVPSHHRPTSHNIPLRTKVARFNAPSSLSNTEAIQPIHSQSWNSSGPSSLLVQYDHSAVLLRDSVITWYKIDITPPLSRPRGISGSLYTIAETISGHTMALSRNAGLALFKDYGDEGEEVRDAEFERIAISPTECPFVCPISGTVGHATSSGDIYVFRQE